MTNSTDRPKKVFLVCGVPGSGKTWVCKQLTDRFNYLPHDEHYKDHATAIQVLAKDSERPVITEVPFAERILRETLEKAGLDVTAIFVIEDPEVVKERYETREKKDIPKANITRATSILNRAKEWNCLYGTSTEVLEIFKKWKP